MTAKRSPMPRQRKVAPPAPTPPAAPASEEGWPLGHTGRRHPPIGLGLWAMGRWTHDDETRTKAVANHAWARGLRWFDTAEVYGTGRSERILGELLSRSGAAVPPAFVTSKLSWEHLRSDQVRASITGTLQRLGARSVDVYLVHAPDPHIPISETMEALERLWKEGKIGAIGVSNFSQAQLEEAQAALRETEIVVNQVRYSLLDRADGDDVLAYCRAHQIVVEAYTPLARGLLAGRYLDGKAPPPDVKRFAHDLFDNDRFPAVLDRARALRGLAKEAKVPMVSLALHWLAARGAAPVFGASDPKQVDEVLSAWAVRPSDGVLERADAIARGALD
jgi:aryl-alcohol dehydrogenase-like predicted oxidoreductase